MEKLHALVLDMFRRPNTLLGNGPDIFDILLRSKIHSIHMHLDSKQLGKICSHNPRAILANSYMYQCYR